MLPPDISGVQLSPDEVARFSRHLILPEVGKAEPAVGGRWHGWAAWVAVGRAQHLPSPGPGPDLGVQLLARIDAKTASPLRLRLPDIEAGPETLNSPGGAAVRCVTGTDPLSQH